MLLFFISAYLDRVTVAVLLYDHKQKGRLGITLHWSSLRISVEQNTSKIYNIRGCFRIYNSLALSFIRHSLKIMFNEHSEDVRCVS